VTPHVKERSMQITRNSLDTNPGRSDWFTGAVYIDTIWVRHVSDDEYAQAPSARGR
jgi:hypothetical protein